ncbi:class I SAM-dependent methyltransferase [Candidatus Nomurabacteria bacterium]|nr:class I SAM-dependent methyltransferase [Candidatus Nomurabacteria bacterium]
MYEILKTQKSKDYELIDSGNGEKLERYGEVILSRPDPQALWEKLLNDKWGDAHMTFNRDGNDGKWISKNKSNTKWQIDLGGFKFWIKPTAFKHVGLFPEQLSNWNWIQDKISMAQKEVSVLNLFGYTGGATLSCAKAGAKVCHVDASKSSISWAKDNVQLSGLNQKPIRYILDDALAFVKKEIKRGHKYDAIIMDPPAFGRGPDGEVWKIEDNFIDLINKCFELLSDSPIFFIINGYSSGYSAIAYKNNLFKIVEKFGGKIEFGELTIEESVSGRLLPSGIFARWSIN